MPSLLASLFRKTPRPPRRWYQKTRYQFPMLVAALLILPVWWLASVAKANLAEAPPAGTVITLPHYHHFGYRFESNSAGKSIWTRYCVMAKGGTVTLTQTLLFRRDVNVMLVLAGLNKSGLFTYEPPPVIPPLVMKLPFCPPGLTQAVPLTTFFPHLKKNGYAAWPKPTPTN